MVNEGLALLEEEKEVHSAAVAWLIKERQNVTDAMSWGYAQRAELKRTIRKKTRERQKLEDDVWQATDTHNVLGCRPSSLGGQPSSFGSKSVHEGTTAAVLTANLVDATTSGVLFEDRGDVEGAACSQLVEACREHFFSGRCPVHRRTSTGDVFLFAAASST